MPNIVVCPQCKKSLISEEQAEHQCKYKIIDINYKWWVNSEVKGIGEVIIIEDEFGTLYRLKPKQPTFDKEKINRRFDRICFVILLPSRLILSVLPVG